MDAQECLASPIIKSLFNENMDDNFTLLPHLGYAVFITSYLDMVLEQNMRYCTTSFLYAIAVSSLASINTVCNEKLIDTGANLKNLIKNLVLVCLFLYFRSSFYLFLLYPKYHRHVSLQMTCRAL